MGRGNGGKELQGAEGLTRRCLHNGHKARGCRNKWKPISSLDCNYVPPPPLPRPALAPKTRDKLRPGHGSEILAKNLQVLHRLKFSMSHRGDASSRPDVDFIVVPTTPEMQAESALLSSNAVVAWLEGARHDISCAQVSAEIASAFGARSADVDVVRHYPE
ncbi:hypothetical protein ZWY2020_028082 [Hordeum vulgare]|nr:hypothetical protein ZWY2020_028082 [Hordeum vulgare]